MTVTTVMLCGVGGQGTILAADLLAKVAAAAGLDVKLSEVHGMAQRGGSVDTVVRFGEEVFSPVTDPGMVDHLVAFEIIEAARRIHYVSPGGRLLVNPRAIQPLPVLTGDVAGAAWPAGGLGGRGRDLHRGRRAGMRGGQPEVCERRADGRAVIRAPVRDRPVARRDRKAGSRQDGRREPRAFELGRGACQKGECAL